MSLLSLPRAGSRSRRLVVCGAAAAVVLLPATAQAETTDPAPVSVSDTAAVTSAPATPSSTAETASSSASTSSSSSTPTTSSAPAAPTSSSSAAPAGTTTATATSTSSAAPTGTTPVTPSETTDQGDLAGAEELDPGMTFPEIDPAALSGLFTPICDTGTLTGLTLQLDQLSGLLQQLKDSGFPIPEEAFSELPSGTIDIPLDDATLGELATELNAASADFAELGLADADIEAALAELPAGIRADVETLIGELQTGTVQPATLRALLEELFPCPVEVPVAPVDQEVVYPGYAPTGGNGSTGGSPLALLGSGAALLAGGGLFAASALRSRAARA